MNKLFTKIAAAFVGIAMAIGVGIAVGNSGVREAKAGAAILPGYTIAKELDTTTTAQGASSGYTNSDSLFTDDAGFKWYATGANQQIYPWRLGGKAADAETPHTANKIVYTGTAINEEIKKVRLTYGTSSSVTVNSATFTVHSNAADAASGSSAISTTTGSVAGSDLAKVYVTNNYVDINLSSGYSGKYYRLVLNVTITSTSNKYLQFSGMAFYKEASGITLTTTSGTCINNSTLDISSYVSGATGTISYVSNNTGIATVNSSGVISPVSNGTTTITVSDSGTSTDATFTVTVRDPYSYKLGEGNYYITINGYFLVSGSISSAKVGSTDVDMSDSGDSSYWTFTNVDGGDDWYTIAQSTDYYLKANNSNDGLRTQNNNTGLSYWLLNTSDLDPSDGITCTLKYGSNNRYISLYTTNNDFRTYTASAATQVINVVLYPVKTLTSISISGSQTTLTGFKAGSSFVPDNTLKVLANFTYAAGTISNYDITSLATWTPSPLVAGSDITVTANYSWRGVAKTVNSSFTITVEAATVATIIATSPTKTEYLVGESFDLSGIAVTGFDSSDDEIGDVLGSCSYKLNGSTIINGSTLSTAGKNMVVTVIYNGDENITDTFNINVRNYLTINSSVLTGTNAYSTVRQGEASAFGTGGKYHSLIQSFGVYSSSGIQFNPSDDNSKLGYIKNLSAVPGNITQLVFNWAAASENNSATIYLDSEEVASDSSLEVIELSDISNYDTNTTVSVDVDVAESFRYVYLDASTLGGTKAIKLVSLVVVYEDEDEGIARNFADYYLHMNDYSANKGYCLDSSDEHYYSTAKTAYGNLSEDQKDYFALLDGAVARFKAWAEANNEEFDEENYSFTPKSPSRIISAIADNQSNTGVLILTIVSIISIVAVGAFFMIRRRKEQ